MNTTQTLEQMQSLRLGGMHHAYRAQLELPLNHQLEGHELLAHLLQAEKQHRANEKTSYYLKLAKLRLPATLEEVECTVSVKHNRQSILSPLKIPLL